MAYLQNQDDEDEFGQPIQGQQAVAAPDMGGGMQPAGQAAPQAFTQVNSSSAKKILDKNRNASLTTGLFDEAKQNFANTQTANENALNQYKTNIGDMANKYSFGEGNAQEAMQLAGNKGLALQGAGPLNLQSANFNPYDIQAAGTGAGLQSMLSRQASKGGQQYGRGMSTLDAAVYMPSASVQQQVGGVLNDYGKMSAQRQQQEAAGKSALEGAQAGVQAKAQQFKGGLENELAQVRQNAAVAGGSDQRMLRGRETIAANEAAYRAALKDAADTAYTGAHMNAGNPLQGSGAGHAFVDKMMKDAGKNQFASANSPEGEYYDEQSAARANKLMQMLGQGGQVTAGGPAQFAVDKDAMQKYMQQQADEYVRQTARNNKVTAAAKKNQESNKLQDAAKKSQSSAAWDGSKSNQAKAVAKNKKADDDKKRKK